MNQLQKLKFFFIVFTALSLNISCFDMYGDIHKGIKLRVGVLLTNNTGIQAYTLNEKGFPQNRNDLFPSYSSFNIVKALSLDYDHDGDCDIVLFTSDTNIIILLNNGKGLFSQLLNEYMSLSGLTDVAAADFNNDGKPDFAVVNNNNSVNVYYSSFSSAFPLPVAAPVRTVITGDINGDGLIDIYAGNNGGPTTNYYFINTSSGGISFNSLTMTVLTSTTTDVSLADIDNDSDNDLILSRGTFIDIYKNDGAGNFIFLEIHSSVSFNSITSGDLNHDGYIDLFIGQTNITAGSETFINNGNGTFTNRHLSTDMNEAKLFDIDFDGDLDIIGKSSSLLVIMKNDGNGYFSLHSSTAVTTPNSIAVFTYEED